MIVAWRWASIPTLPQVTLPIRSLRFGLEPARRHSHTSRMSTSLHDVAREIEFVAAVRQGLDEIDRGERIPIEEIERELPSWVIR